MSLILKRSPYWGLNSKTSSILTFEAGDCLPGNGIVMLDPEDETCSTVIPWDGVDECDQMGVLRCPVKVAKGKCVSVQVFQGFSLNKCSGGTGGEIDTMDTELECFCDETGQEFIGFFTVDHTNLTAPPTVSYALADGTPYTPVGEIQKTSGKTTPVKKELSVIDGKQTITTDDTTAVSFVVPAGAVGAFIQVTTSCCARVCWDGSVPTPKEGIEVGHLETICVGCTPGPNVNGVEEEVVNFQIIATEGCIAAATAIFYE